MKICWYFEAEHMKESELQKQIMLALSQAGCIVWRNETAGAWVGRATHRDGDTVTIAGARMIQAGLCVGGADIIGIHRATGRMIAVEVKTPTGRLSAEQGRFLDAVKHAGGIAGVARSAREALDLLP